MRRGARGSAFGVVLVLAASITLSGCGQEPAPEPVGRETAVTIQDPRIHESSGLAASDLHPGVLYTQNDMGNAPEVFALNADGSTAAVLTLAGARNVDWEDIAVADDRVYVGDTGGGRTERDTISVLAFDEPDTLADAEPAWTRIELAYPDGAHNAEALLVRPGSDRIYVVTKDSPEGAIYAAPEDLRPGVNRLERVGEAPPNITSGDFAPAGEMFALRNEKRAFLYRELGARPRVLELPESPQGESLAFVDGALLVGSEGVGSKVVTVPLGRDLQADLQDAD